MKTVTLSVLTTHLNNLLKIDTLQDYGPNGLQVEGKKEITRIVTGVSACNALFQKAIALKADAIIVHHGLFWNNLEMRITNFMKKRVSMLLQNDISLLGYHLPLDIHPELGNNAQIAQLLNANIIGELKRLSGPSVGIVAKLPKAHSPDEFEALITEKFNRQPTFIKTNRKIQTIGISSGGAQGYFIDALSQGIDAYITGEISEYNPHIAQESGVNFISAGHYATERGGIMALSKHIEKHLGISCLFIDIENDI